MLLTVVKMKTVHYFRRPWIEMVVETTDQFIIHKTSVGLFGATRECSMEYLATPHTLNSTALFFSVELISFV